jgi:hypothetical protein
MPTFVAVRKIFKPRTDFTVMEVVGEGGKIHVYCVFSK